MAAAPRRTALSVRLAAALAAALLLSLAVLGAADLVLAWRDSGETPGLAEEAHCVYDPELGWANEKGARVEDLYGPGRSLTINAQGFRAREEYARAVPPGRFRVICLGDSFTLGYGVDDASTYPAELEALAPGIQAVNMGQGGYGVDQCYLWYRRDGAELDADLLQLAFIAPDFERIGETRFQGEYPKPVLTVEDGALRLPEGPLPRDWESRDGSRRFRRFVDELALGELVRRWKRHGALPLPEPVSPAHREVAELVLADLARLARERGQGFVLVHLPLRQYVGTPGELLAWLGSRAGALGIPLVDLAAEFEELSPGERDASWLADGHLNPFGNRWVAGRLLAHLRERFPEVP